MRIISWGVSISVVSEIVGITLQSARGVPSHFNSATPLDAAIFAAMGMMIGINTVLLIWVCVLFFVDHPDISTGYLWGIRFGLICSCWRLSKVCSWCCTDRTQWARRWRGRVAVRELEPGAWRPASDALRRDARAAVTAAGWVLDGAFRASGSGASLLYGGVFLLYFGTMAVLFWMAWGGIRCVVKITLYKLATNPAKLFLIPRGPVRRRGAETAQQVTASL